MAADRVTLPPALRTLVEAGGTLVRRSSSGRFALGRTAALVEEDALPGALRAWPARLERARAEVATPIAFKDVEKALKGAWGRPPGKVLDALEREPVAVTPGAQVHRGERGGDGAAVAVKVLRPGLASAVRHDLALLDVLAAPLGAVFGAMDAGTILREIRESVLDELDLEHEASTQRSVRRTLRGVPELVVPTPDLELSSASVLVSEWLDGPTLADARPGDPAAVARTLVAAHVAAARAGYVLTDPRPGHVVLLDRGGVGLLGAGVARPADRDRVAAALDALVAFRSEDQDAFAAIVADRLALLPSASDAIKTYGWAAVVLDGLLGGEARLDAPALAGVGERALEHLTAALALAATVAPRPADLAVARSVGQLTGVLSRLGATEDWGGLVLESA
ncbi:MAG TPA: AarF/UbiB family protein [Baekduia sp.]|uniref:AarF/UbiB family protein n=1 Tax=Baekduia sp. TaxID=2600305 RepID=UPI002D79E53B|nr:AarF/UbiB family protein [Baekduia sp.]HET6505453.1 AarF/UbiB family protein [Baekduia sp.]